MKFNPFLVVAMSCVMITILYMLGWSSLYEELSPAMLFFLGFCFISSLISSVAYQIFFFKKSKQYFMADYNSKQNLEIAIFILIAAGFMIEFFHFGGVPILSAISLHDVDYREFGIPVIHVFLVGFNVFYALSLFDRFLTFRSRSSLFLSLASAVWPILFMSRGGFVVICLGFVFLIIKKYGLKKYYFKVLLGLLIFLFGFGYIGDVRTNAMGIDSEDIILKIGGATDKFINSGMPNTLYWAYLYMTSPLANFQTTINQAVGSSNVFHGFLIDFFPDFVSKRLLSQSVIESYASLRITPELTVGTAYSRLYVTMGWLGPYLFHIYYLISSLFLLVLSKGSKYENIIFLFYQ